jgi:hypothetical protein
MAGTRAWLVGFVAGDIGCTTIADTCHYAILQI